ncbi:bromodomain-containing protein DDB_G0270170-like isoform X3 [Varroa jacobsoni]|uniref:Bromo domain-containing protein n=2 Tax=Varroa TaxID=62624 RepID=A0A7M7J7Y2_VARDE|nr:bromodomain-containing protein DDB_G0270170-like isoform X2 [Varroa destructor]XP_022708295.1 bromodomain-containing protein DDB_G0270170-like isoform X3 [Varroa jacobsoni]
MPMEQSPQPVAASSGSAPPKSGIKLVLKVGGSSASTGGVSPASSGSSVTQNAPVVAYSSTVPAPTPLYSGGYPPTGGISLRLVTNPDNAECTVKKVENPLINGTTSSGAVAGASASGTGGAGSVQSDSLSETSSYLQQHRHKKSDKKKKKKKKHHHHHSHCHHHKDHHKHHHGGGEKRKDRVDGDGLGMGGGQAGGGSGTGGNSGGAAGDDDDDDGDVAPPPPKRPVMETIDNQPPLPEVPLRSPVGVLPSGPREVSPLYRLLGVLLELVRKRDTYEFFAWPVNDAIAPGYSTIITRPMDLSTMKRRVDNREYPTLEAFKADLRLICDNATTYNQPDTIYYKEARKLWRHSQKILSKEHILQLDPELKYIGAVPVDQLGFDLRSITPEPIEEMTPRMTRNRVQHNASSSIRVGNDDEPVELSAEKMGERPVPPVKISLAATVVEQALATVGAPESPAVVTRDDKEGVLAGVARSHRVSSLGGRASSEGSPVLERTYSQEAKREDLKDVTGKETPTRPAGSETPTELNGDITCPDGTPVRSVSPPGLAKKSKPDDEQQSQVTPPDDASAAEILAHAQRMARGAANRLAMLKPNTDYAFLLQNDDGSATLSILNPDVTLTDKYVGLRPAELPVPPQKVDLEMLVGKLPYGMSSLVDFKDEARSVAKPINYTVNESGPPFSTFAPHYDSSFSNLTKVESDLVYQTYGDELGVQYADSIMHFAKDCDYLMNMVDNLLDTLTGGQHSKTLKLVRSGELLRDPDEEESTSSDKQQTKEKDSGKSSSDKDRANQRSHAAEKAQSLSEKSSFEKQQDKVITSSNGPSNQAGVIMANGTGAAKCNGNATHGINPTPVISVPAVGKPPLVNGHGPPMNSGSMVQPLSNSLHNGVPQIGSVQSSNVGVSQIMPCSQPQMIGPGIQMPSQQQPPLQHHPTMAPTVTSNHNQSIMLPSSNTNSGPAPVMVGNHFVTGNVQPNVENHFSVNNVHGQMPPTMLSGASGGLVMNAGNPIVPGTVGTPAGVGLVGKSMAGSLHQGGLPTQPLVAPLGGVSMPMGSLTGGSPVVITRTPAPGPGASTGSPSLVGTGANSASTNAGGTAPGDNEQKLQAKLAESTEMIERLTRLQRERLSQPPPPHLGMTQGPSPTELQLAEKLAATLSELASHAKPGSIVSVDAIRRAMGITLLPPNQQTKPQQPTQLPTTTQKTGTAQAVTTAAGYTQPATSHAASTSSTSSGEKTL